MKKVSDKIIRYSIRGMLMAFNPMSNSPVFLEIDGKFLLPIFSTKDKFDEAAKWGGFTFAKYNIIVDPEEFRNSVLQYKKKFLFHVVADPCLTNEGNTQFQLIPFDDEEASYLKENHG